MSRIPERVETDRLIAERAREEHAPGLAALLGEPAIARWFWPGPEGGPEPVREAAEWLARDAAAWEREGWGPWMLRDPASGAVIGRAGLASNVIEGRTVVELAWMLTPARWGEGLVPEVARRAVQAGFDDLGAEELIAITLVDNLASQAVMRKLGMTFERRIEHAGHPHVLASLKRSTGPAGRRP